MFSATGKQDYCMEGHGNCLPVTGKDKEITREAMTMAEKLATSKHVACREIHGNCLLVTGN
jgi:hypothetical protein